MAEQHNTLAGVDELPDLGGDEGGVVIHVRRGQGPASDGLKGQGVDIETLGVQDGEEGVVDGGGRVGTRDEDEGGEGHDVGEFE